MQKNRIRAFFSFFLFIVLFEMPLSAWPKKKKAETPVIKTEEKPADQNSGAAESETDSSEKNSEFGEDEGTAKAIMLPAEKKTRSYFHKIDSSVLQLVENGSPQTITQAITKMRRNLSDYDESEKVLIAVATDIMKLVWPSERISWESFSYTDITPYTESLNSVKNGVFDSSTGNTDFLTTVLPAILVLSSSVSVSDIQLCETALKSAEEKNSDSVLCNYLMGVTLEKLGNISVAQNYLKKAYEGCQTNVEIQIELAKVLRLNNKLTEAENVLMNVTPDKQFSIEVLKQNAYIAFEKKDFDNSEQYVNRVLQQTPNDLDFVLFRAKILIEKKDYIHAVSLLDMYSRQNDSSLEYLILRSKVQLDWSKNTTAALETVEKALRLYPDDKQALLIAASIAALTDAPVAGKYSDELAEKILKMEPDNKQALICQLDGLTLHENWKQAYETCSKLIALPSVDSDIVLTYVTICEKLGKKEEAFNYTKKVYKERPNDEVILLSYVYAYSETGAREEVIKFIDSLINSASSKVKSSLYYRRSFLQKSEDNSLADLRSSLIANPRNSESLFRLYEIYYDKKDYRKAQYYLRQVVAINPNDTSVKKLNEVLTTLIN